MSFFKTPIGRVAAVVLVVLLIALFVVLIRGVGQTSKGPGTGDASPVPVLRAQVPVGRAVPVG